MNPNVAYWTGALVNMAAIVAIAGWGVTQARAGRLHRHRRAMQVAVALVLVFLASYAAKLLWLGREALEDWSPFALNMLRFHELCVAGMLVGGGVALLRSRRLSRSRLLTGNPTDPAASPSDARRHRRAGRAALVAAVLGVLTAGFVLGGMYTRAGLLDLPPLAARE